jgi:hypothetical protein
MKPRTSKEIRGFIVLQKVFNIQDWSYEPYVVLTQASLITIH